MRKYRKLEFCDWRSSLFTSQFWSWIFYKRQIYVKIFNQTRTRAKIDFTQYSVSSYCILIELISSLAVRIRQPNIDSIFFFATISLLVIIYLFTEYTQRTVYTRSKLKTTHTYTSHAQRHRQRHPSINRNSSEISPHRRTSYNSEYKRRSDTSRRIIFFIAVGLVVNMGVALRLGKPIEKGPVKKLRGLRRTQYTYRRSANKQNEIACWFSVVQKKSSRYISKEKNNKISNPAAPSGRELQNFQKKNILFPTSTRRAFFVVLKRQKKTL